MVANRNEYFRVYNKKWRDEHREQYRAYCRERYRKQTPEEKKAEQLRLKQYCLEHPEKVKEHNRKYHLDLKLTTLARYGGKCACCGEDQYQFLAIDHPNGDGGEERKRLNSNGGNDFYRILKRNGYPEGYRVLCHNCNMAIANYGICPHTRAPQLRSTP